MFKLLNGSYTIVQLSPQATTPTHCGSTNTNRLSPLPPLSPPSNQTHHRLCSRRHRLPTP
ncbi:hypothetical protein HanPSC8_Chr09g0402101 [Helianthus annuus]|nr:hypothetical protein HanPSC8_Chr09g0402101 [Helianthus annuus]